MRDEGKFIDRVYQEIEKNRPLMGASDSNDWATKHFHKCCKKYPKMTDKFILITADTDVRITDADLNLKDKFVFYLRKSLLVLISTQQHHRTSSFTSKAERWIPLIYINRQQGRGILKVCISIAKVGDVELNL